MTTYFDIPAIIYSFWKAFAESPVWAAFDNGVGRGHLSLALHLVEGLDLVLLRNTDHFSFTASISIKDASGSLTAYQGHETKPSVLCGSFPDSAMVAPEQRKPS